MQYLKNHRMVKTLKGFNKTGVFGFLCIIDKQFYSIPKLTDRNSISVKRKINLPASRPFPPIQYLCFFPLKYE